MAYATTTNPPVEIQEGVPFETETGQYPANWLELSDDDDKAAAGVAVIVEPPAAPAGKRNRILGLDVVDGVPTRTFVVEDVPAPPTPQVPQVLSGRQFWQQAANDGIISEDEAYTAATTGTMPKVVTDAIAQLPAAVRFPTKMKIGSATEFKRNDEATAMIGQLLQKDDAALDAYWLSAFAL